jgi:hypothetical protein
MKGRSKKRTLLAASVAGLLAIAGALANAGVVYAEEVQCGGINACKGTGECGGKESSCAGKNACKGLGWVSKATETECLEAGGTVIPAAAPVAG